MPDLPKSVALALDPAAIEGALQTLAAQQRGITLSGAIAGAERTELGVVLRFHDALLHLGPAPRHEKVAAPAPKPPDPAP